MKAIVVIEFDMKTHSLTVKGSALSDKVLTYGMLELAKETVAKQANQPERMVQPVSLIPVNGGKAS